MKNNVPGLWVTIIGVTILWVGNVAYSQVEIISLYPTQNYLTAPRETDLYAVFNLDLDESTVVDTNIVVFAERTGTHFGNLSYDAGSRTLTFDPDNDFIAGERVRVTLTNKIKGASGESFRGFTWHFTVETFGDDDFEFVYRGETPAGFASKFEAADFNNDGYPDIVAIQNVFGVNALYLFLNDQNGGFYFHDIILDADVHIPSVVEGLDFNKDGWTDIHIVGRHIFLINRGNNQFDELYADSLFPFLSWGTTADFDNDGELDMVVSPWEVDSLCVYQGLGNFLFELDYCASLPKTAAFFTPKEEAFDLNTDGLIDVISPLFPYARDSIIVLMNLGNLMFDEPDIYDPGLISGQNSQYTNDLDQDGDMDHVVFGGRRADTARAILYNNGDGTFTFGNYYPEKEARHNPSGGDFDADGDIDFVGGGFRLLSTMPVVYEGYVTILRNDGYDNFTIDRQFTIGEGVDKAIFLDYDLDGDLDIVGIRWGDYLFWMENTSILSTDVSTTSSMPEGFELFQNYPNPFNSSTRISYHIPESVQVNLKIYDISGSEIVILVSEKVVGGRHEVIWDGLDSRGKEVSSGIYFIHIKAGQFVQTGKTVLLR